MIPAKGIPIHILDRNVTMTNAPAFARVPFLAQRRRFLKMAGLGAVGLALPSSVLAVPQISAPASLSELVTTDALTGPLLPFRTLGVDPDGEIKAHIYREVAHKSGLMAHLKKRLETEGPISLDLREIKVDLQYVPETRTHLARAYQTYCRQAIAHTCQVAQVPSFYRGIFLPQTANPEIAAGDGVSAFVVHRLAKAYEAICDFSAGGGRNDRHVKFKVAGAIYSSHLGAVEMDVEGLPDGSYRIQRRNYTIWQDYADNVYTLLQIPVEETLHYLMGRHTDRQLRHQLRADAIHQAAQVEEIASNWMAVEEAIVGGLVEQILPVLIRRQELVLDAGDVKRSAAAKAGLPQYRYRDLGLRLVASMGARAAMEMYREDPLAFRKQLTQA
jgi:hypothetical protein